jgi:hypothetical protein
VTNLPPDPHQPPPPAPPGGPYAPGSQPPAAPYPPGGQPGAPYLPPSGQPAPPRKRRTGLIIGIAVVVLLALCGIGTTAAVLGLKPAAKQAQEFAKSIGDLKTGDCVKPATLADQYVGASCSSKDKIGKVSKVFPGTEANGDQQNCPVDSDLLLADAGKIICVKGTTSELLGQPGKGGGIVVAGDCVGESGELACTDPKASEKVSARVAAVAACAAPAVRFFDLELQPLPVICLADGPGIAGPGECIASLSGSVSLDQAPCASGKPKVLARKPTQAACEAVPGMTHWLEDQQGLPPTKFVCVKEG